MQPTTYNKIDFLLIRYQFLIIYYNIVLEKKVGPTGFKYKLKLFNKEPRNKNKDLVITFFR